MPAPSIYEQARAFANLTAINLDHNRYLTATDEERLSMWVEEASADSTALHSDGELENACREAVEETESQWSSHVGSVTTKLDTIHDRLEAEMDALYDYLIPESGQPADELKATFKDITDLLDTFRSVIDDLNTDPT